MKLLRGQSQIVEDGKVKLSVGVIDMVTQATIATMALDTSLQGRIKLVAFMLRSCVNSVEIDGVEYEPSKIASNADISDEGTRATVLKIATMIVGVAFPSGEDEKK